MTQKCILGIDPGAKSGIVVVTIENQPKLLAHTIWNKNSKKTRVRPSHIVTNYSREYNIVGAAIEEQYLGINVNTLKVLSRVAGAWEEACLSRNIPVYWVAATTWQSKIIGKRRGKKREELGRAYEKLAELDTGIKLSPDESAAWSLARYQVTEMTFKNRLSR